MSRRIRAPGFNAEYRLQVNDAPDMSGQLRSGG